MADSLLDFGNIAQLAQNNLRNAMQMQQMGLQEQQFGLQEKRVDIDKQQLEVSRQNAQTARLNSIKSIMDHPLVQNNEDLQHQLFVSVAPELGIPVEGLSDKLTQSSKDRMELLSATLGNDPQKATNATIKLMSAMGNEDASKFLKNIEAIPGLHAKALLAKQTMEMNEAKFAELRQNQAIVNEGRGPITALSSSLRDQVRVFDDPGYKKAQSIYKTLGKTSILDPADRTLTEKEKMPLKNLMRDNAEQLAENLEPEIMRWQHQLDTANRTLIDMEHGIKQPGQMKEQLTARIATAGPILGALRDMQAAYRDPLNPEKAELAKHAYKTIEARRVELETMDKKLDAQRMGLVNLANEKFDYKQSQDNAIALGQQEYFALPDKQRNGQAAAKIAAKITQETGVPVKVSDIIKDPNAPSSVTNVNMTQEKAFDQELGKENAKDIKETRIKARDAVEIIDTIHQGRKLLDSGVITGVGAEYLTTFGQALSQAGFTESEDKVANTRAYVSLMANNVGKLIKQFGSGTGLSDSDRKYAERMAAGDITIGEPSIRKIMDMSERAARNVIARHNESVKGVKSMVPLTVDAPPEYAPSKQPSASPSGKAAPSSGKAQPPAVQQQFVETRTTKDGRKLGKTADGKIVEIK